MDRPLFTVLTTTFNAGSSINIAAASVRVQGRSDVEYIVIDGASSDETLAHVNRNGDVVTRVISEPDRGIYDALNKGIAAARGELIGIIGADDAYLSGALDIVEKYHRRSPADIYAGQTLLTTSAGRGVLRQDEDYGIGALVSGIPFGHNAMFARRSAYEAIGLHDLQLRICGDADWVHRAIQAGLTCTRIPRVLTQFSPTGVSTADSTGIIRESGMVICKSFPFLDLPEATTLLYCVRGWTDPRELVPILQRHSSAELRASVANAFRERPDVWAMLQQALADRAHLAPSGALGSAAAMSLRDRTERRESPRFTFIIPAYNVAGYIGKCLTSILTQPFLNIEVIVVDDGSTDETAAVVERFAARDGRIELIRQANAGQGAARAVALARARGEYVWCVDSDDHIQAQVLDRINGMINNTSAEVLVLNYAYENEDESVEYSGLVPAWLAGRTVDPLSDERTFSAVSAWTCPPWRYVISMELIKRAGIKFHGGLFYEDHPFAIDVITAAERVHVDSTISYYYLRRSDSTVRSLDKRAFDFLPIRRLVLDRLRSKRLLERFTDIAVSYVLPIDFIKAHVSRGDRAEFLTRLAEDTLDDEALIVGSHGGLGELELVEALARGEAASVDIDAFASRGSHPGETIAVSRSLRVADVQGLSWTEGPYPQFGIGEQFRWVDGHTLKVRARTGGLTRPALLLRYRNAQEGQFITVEQNDTWIEMFPCRSARVDEVAQLSIPLMPDVGIVRVTINIRKLDQSSGRALSLAVQELEVIDELTSADSEAGAQMPGPPDLIAKGPGTDASGLQVDVRRDVQPRSYVRIGRDSNIGGAIVFERGIGEVTIGNRTSIGHGCLLICTQEKGITIGNNVMLSWDVTVMDTDAHSVDPAVRANDAFDWLVGEQTGRRGLYKDWTNVKSAPVAIKDGAWIGFGSSILKGVTIGTGAVIGCNSVVTKDVPDFAIVAGNPARVVGEAPNRLRIVQPA